MRDEGEVSFWLWERRKANAAGGASGRRAVEVEI